MPFFRWFANDADAHGGFPSCEQWPPAGHAWVTNHYSIKWWPNANRKRAGGGAHSCQSVAIGGIWVQCFGDRAQKPRAPAWWECRRAALDKGTLFRCQGQWIVGHS